MDLVEKELTWVIHSPNFFAPEAPEEACRQSPPDSFPALPGPLKSAQVFENLSQLEIKSLLSRPTQWQQCLSELRTEIPKLASGRLGLRFEKYLHTILTTSFGAENVMTRLAVREVLLKAQVKTWGEYDFLIVNREQNRLEHWESSIKFYLQVKDDPDWKWCLGPGLKDRLDLKGPKTFLQQLALSSTDLGSQVIPPQVRLPLLVKRVFAKGTVFYRWSPRFESLAERLGRCVQPSALTQEHLKSWWITSKDVRDLRDHFPDIHLALLPRKYWMTGLDTETSDEALFETWDEFFERLPERLKSAQDRNECLLVGLYSAGNARRLLTSGFIASDLFAQAAMTVNTQN